MNYKNFADRIAANAEGYATGYDAGYNSGRKYAEADLTAKLTKARNEGYASGRKDEHDAQNAARKTYATGGYTGIAVPSEDIKGIGGQLLYAGQPAFNFPKPATPTPTHLDALDLVIEAFGLQEQYPAQGYTGAGRAAQRLYDDLLAAQKFRKLHDAHHRVQAASIANGFDAGVEATFESLREDDEQGATA